MLGQLYDGPPRAFDIALQRKRPHLDLNSRKLVAIGQQWSNAAGRVLNDMDDSGMW